MLHTSVVAPIHQPTCHPFSSVTFLHSHLMLLGWAFLSLDHFARVHVCFTLVGV